MQRNFPFQLTSWMVSTISTYYICWFNAVVFKTHPAQKRFRLSSYDFKLAVT